MRCCIVILTPHQSPAVTASPQGEAFGAAFKLLDKLGSVRSEKESGHPKMPA